MTAAARLRGITRHYRDTDALTDVSLDLPADTVTALIGRNGAGKTTLMRILTAQDFPTSGSVEVFGRAPHDDRDVLSRVCFVGESQRYPSPYSVSQVLRAAAILHPLWDAELADKALATFDLPVRRQVSKLSRGMLSAVGIVVGLASRAPLTVFDEPYLGLDAVARHRFYDLLLGDYLVRPRTVLLSTHLIDEVADLVEHVLLLDRGRLVLDEGADALRGRAATVAGPEPAVAEFVAGRGTLADERIGTYRRVMVDRPLGPGEAAAARSAGLTVEPVSLQQYVVRLTGDLDDATADRPFVKGAVS